MLQLQLPHLVDTDVTRLKGPIGLHSLLDICMYMSIGIYRERHVCMYIYTPLSRIGASLTSHVLK